MPRIDRYFIGDIRRPEHGQVIYRDDDLKGFGIRATRGSVSYIAERRVGGKVRRFTIGRCDRMSLETARKEASRLLSGVAASTGVKTSTLSVTLEQVLEKYLASRKLRPNTIKNYNNVTRRCLKDWLDKPILSITRQMVAARHRELTRVTKQGTAGEVQANMAMRNLCTLINFAIINYGEADDPQPDNPVKILSQSRAWHREPRRRSIIPDHKLAAWYKAIMSLNRQVVRDYLLFLLLTGLRRNEAATLRWKDIDFEAKTLTIRAEVTKNKHEHCLPLSNFLQVLLTKWRVERSDSEYVFPGRGGRGHIVDSGHVISRAVATSGCSFVLHDLRRTFVSMAGKIGIPHHLIKKLINHIAQQDPTDGYIVVSVEHLRQPLELITARFLELMEVDPEGWDRAPQTTKYKVATVTLKEILEHYLCVKKLGAESYLAYRRAVEKRLTDWLPLSVASITGEMVRIKYQELTTTDGLCKASKVQANYTMRVLKTLLNFASENYWVDDKPVVLVNPVRALKQINTWNRIRPRRDVITNEQLPDWYQAVISLRSTTVRDLLLLMLHTGLPKAAAATICWKEVDFESRVLTARIRNRAQTLPMSSFVLGLLRKRYLQRRSPYVFPGRSQQIDRITEILNQVRKSSGCQFELADLRRTFLLTAQRLGLTSVALQQLAIRGYGSEQVVGDLLSVESLREPMQNISDELNRLVGETTRKAG